MLQYTPVSKKTPSNTTQPNSVKASSNPAKVADNSVSGNEVLKNEPNRSTKFKPKFLPRLKRFFRKRWWIFLLLFLILAGGGWYWQNQQKSQVEPTLVNPTIQDLSQTIDVPCVVDAKQKANIRFLSGGKVVYLGAKEGEWVKKYQTIAKIDTKTLEKQLQQDLNRYMQERWSWDQTVDDTADRFIDEREKRLVDKEQWDLENQVLNVEIKDIAVRDSAISSPIAGILTSSPTAVSGVQLSPTDAFVIVDPATLICRAAIDEVDIAPVQLDMPVTVTLDSFPDRPFNSQLTFISPTASRSESGTVFLVEAPLSGIGDLNTFRIGMNGDAVIEILKKNNVMVVPIDATRSVDGETVVSVKIGDDTFEDRVITTGIETDDLIEVISGLTVDDQVVIPE